MLMIHELENRVLQLFKEGRIAGSTHLCQGQEAVYVGACSCLRYDDFVLGTYRGHGEALAKGLQPNQVLSEILGKSTSCAKEKGGSMHLTKKEIGLVGTFSVVAAGLPCAVGLGLSCKFRGTAQVTVCFFSDGATNNGAFHEALNMAAIWNVPGIFVCLNNLYSEYTPI
jgi:pyruvate dehydrogenase E1 component alpha subunit